MAPDQQSEQVRELRRHWGAVYRIGHSGTEFTAVNRRTGTVLRAATADVLLKEMRKDYRTSK